jgi:hypothetical protein
MLYRIVLIDIPISKDNRGAAGSNQPTAQIRCDSLKASPANRAQLNKKAGPNIGETTMSSIYKQTSFTSNDLFATVSFISQFNFISTDNRK